MKSELIWSEFNRCSKDLTINCELSETDVKNFFCEWTRKMVHARLGEFLKCYNMQQATAVRKRIKGGQSLRDELFCATKKRKTKLVKNKNAVTKTPTKKDGVHVELKSTAGQSRVTEQVSNQSGQTLATKVNRLQKSKAAETKVSEPVSNKSGQTPTTKMNTMQKSTSVQSNITELVNNKSGQTPIRKSKRTCKSRKLDLYEYD